MAAEVLTDLYKAEAASKVVTQKAAGYAVFDNPGVNVLLLSRARGSGRAADNKTKQETFMKMVSAAAKACEQGQAHSGAAELAPRRLSFRAHQKWPRPSVDPAGHGV